jgi:hypothetical protein
MVDLFRFIEHDFAVPSATDAIKVAHASDFQRRLDDLVHGGDPAARVRAFALGYLTEHFATPIGDPIALSKPLTALPGALRARWLRT